MYILFNFCESSGVLRIFYILKICFNIVLTILPIIVIISMFINIFKAVMSGKEDDVKNILPDNIKRIIAALIVFFLPGVFDYVFSSLVDMNVEFASCWTNASLDGINTAVTNEENALKEEKDKRQEELKAVAEERAALEKAKNEIIKQQKEEYNNGGDLDSEVISGGTSGIYFAPLQGINRSPSGSSLTGGCSNNSPVYHDIGVSVGTPVYAAYDGTVKYIQSNCNGVLYSYGNQARLYKEDGTYIIYAHFSKFPDGINMPIKADCKDNGTHKTCGAGHCSAGMTSTQVAEVKVKKGQVIGYTGNTGNSTGPHLHVEIHDKGSRACVTDPWSLFGMR